MSLIALRFFASGLTRRTHCLLFVAFLTLVTAPAAYSQTVPQPAPSKDQAPKDQAAQATADQAAKDGAAQAAKDQAAKQAATPAITSVAIFPQAAAQTAAQATSQNFIIEITGTNFASLKDAISNHKVKIAVLPEKGVTPAQIEPLSISQDNSMILAQFTAPPSYSLDGVTLWTGTDLLRSSAGSLSCDFSSKVTLTPQVVPKEQAGNKYGNGVAKNFYAIQISIVNECPMAIIVPLAGMRVVVTELRISTYSPLPRAALAAPYQLSLDASGGIPPYMWSLPQNSLLPAGLALSDSGAISGTLASGAQPGNFPFSVRVSDSSVPPLSTVAQMVLPVSTQIDGNAVANNPTSSAEDDCTEKGDLVAFSLDHVTSIFSADRKLTGRRAIYFNTVQALATLGSSVELFLPHGFAQGVAILGGGFTTASKDILVDMSSEQLQNLTSQSFGSTEQVASHGSLQKFIFVRRSIHKKCKNTPTEMELRYGEFTVLWEVSPAAAEAPTTQAAPAAAPKAASAPAVAAPPSKK